MKGLLLWDTGKKTENLAVHCINKRMTDCKKCRHLVTANVLINSKIQRILQEKFTAFRPTRRTSST